jgi:pimeloyl-ACP methyl ester carboxylesterase
MSHRHWIAVPALLVPAAAPAQAPEPHEVARWQIYGTAVAFARTPALPGGGSVEAAPSPAAAEPWSSGAVMTLPRAWKAGERVTAVFWARAAQPQGLTVTVQGGAPAHVAIGQGAVALTPTWRRYSISATATADLPAGSQSLVVQLGRTRAAVALGPVALIPGTPDAAAVDRAFAALRPVQLAEDVTIASDAGVTLSGTLRLPQQGSGPHPVAILLPGHGPWPRGGYPLLTDRLLAAGIGVFDYDKRGIGRSTGRFEDTMETTARDAAAAVRFLHERTGVDGRRIAVIGHSQGGAIAPGLAADDPAIAAVVTLAGPAGEKGKLFLDGMRESLKAGGTRANAVEPVVAAARPYMDALSTGAAPATIAPLEQALRRAFAGGGWGDDKVDSFIATLSHPVVVSQYRVAASEALRRVKAPVLALYAGEDDVVATRLGMPAATAALAGNGDATVAEMPETNHGFQRRTLAANGSAVFEGPSVSDPATLDRVTDWLRQRLTP